MWRSAGSTYPSTKQFLRARSPGRFRYGGCNEHAGSYDPERLHGYRRSGGRRNCVLGGQRFHARFDFRPERQASPAMAKHTRRRASRTMGISGRAGIKAWTGTNSCVQSRVRRDRLRSSGARTLVAWVNPNAGGGRGIPDTHRRFDAGGRRYFRHIRPDREPAVAAASIQLYIDHGGTCYVSDNSPRLRICGRWWR